MPGDRDSPGEMAAGDLGDWVGIGLDESDVDPPNRRLSSLFTSLEMTKDSPLAIGGLMGINDG